MELPEDWTTGVVHANGADIRWYRGGDGQQLVAAHGFYANGRCWLPLATNLTDEFEVVTYDARGHGRSAAPEHGYDIENRVADLVGVLDALELNDPVVIGHSMGAATAAWAAATYPDRPRALLLEDPVGIHATADEEMAPEKRAEVTRERLAGIEERSVDELVASEYEEFDPGWARRLAVAATECSPKIAEIAREGYPKPLRMVFPDIECPTLVVRSDAETERRVKDLDAASSLAEGRIVHIPDAGHHVFHDAPEAARAELRAFLSRVG